MALPTLSAGGTNTAADTTTSVYGTNASNAVTYAFTSVTVGSSVAAGTFNSLMTSVNQERVRRSSTAAAWTSLVAGATITAAHINTIKNALSVAGPASSQAYNTTGTITITTYPQAAAPTVASDFAIGAAIGAADINGIITALNTAGAVCTCNCNYCTCNCNYCTCNCNYACTCNCNYSDIRLKENIKFIRVESGLNVYSWNYVWDQTKIFVGVIAQEILNTQYFSAVNIDKHGYYLVDYSKLPVTIQGL